MTIVRYTRSTLALLLAATIGSPALAQTDAASARYPGTDYLNGGIGTEEADRMRVMSADFPVQMTFAQRGQGGDEFVADVHLRVTNSSGRAVIDLPSQGPIFLLQVRPGSYTVEAEHDGQVKTQHFDVAAGRHDRLGFEW
ncbi:MAG TPA: hypothetical protein VLN42_02220 [Casimicrobiaceae bacterium]|nr:hypothetical protein [Casimicrobiaceae bacterium]